MKRILSISAAALVSVSMLAACGSDDDNNTVADVVDANAGFCQDLRTYVDSLTAFTALDPATATKEEYESAAGDIKSARSDLAGSRADLVEAEIDNLEAQADDLEGALADASDDAVVADIVTAAQKAVAEVQVSAAAVDTAICTADNSTTSEG